jgi:hypothetical protein
MYFFMRFLYLKNFLRLIPFLFFFIRPLQPHFTTWMMRMRIQKKKKKIVLNFTFLSFYFLWTLHHFVKFIQQISFLSSLQKIYKKKTSHSFISFLSFFFFWNRNDVLLKRINFSCFCIICSKKYQLQSSSSLVKCKHLMLTLLYRKH